MPIFYSPIDIKGKILPAQFTRMRHRYRGPRESEKINLEHHQIFYSITKLFQQYNDIREELNTTIEFMYSGDYVGSVEFQGLLQPYEGLEPSPDLQPGADTFMDLWVNGLGEVGQRIQTLNARVRNLENR